MEGNRNFIVDSQLVMNGMNILLLDQYLEIYGRMLVCCQLSEEVHTLQKRRWIENHHSLHHIPDGSKLRPNGMLMGSIANRLTDKFMNKHIGWFIRFNIS